MTELIDIVEHWVVLIKDLLWAWPLLVIFFGVAIYQTWHIKGLQFRFLGRSIKLVFSEDTHKTGNEQSFGDISTFQSIMTALGGAIGTGNITGIATAVATGGVGALFWMWVMAILGMATAYSETVLGVKYRIKNAAGQIIGGPMYALELGLKSPVLAKTYALFVALATLSLGCIIQSNSVVDAVVDVYPGDRFMLGVILAIVTGCVVIGGVKSIGKAASVLVPFMGSGYIIVSLIIIGWHYNRIFDAFYLIFTSAFTGQAAVGGFVGSTIMLALQNGVQYGILANEAGLGSLSIAGASAKTNCPVEQGMRSIGSVFFSTMIVCTLTGLVLTVTQVVGEVDATGRLIKGSSLAMMAFGSIHNSLRYIVMVGLILFAFTTMLAWAYYGEKSVEYILGIKCAYIYRWIFTGIVVIGAVLHLDLVWAIANLVNAFIAIPNLIAVVGLSKEIKEITIDYFNKL